MMIVLRKFLIPLILMAGLPVMAQVTFVIESLPENTPDSSRFYIVGDFQGWDPGHPEYILHKNKDGKWSITLEAMPDATNIQYKFTRGSWETVEKDKNGEEIENRLFTFGNGREVFITISNWSQEQSNSKSTASWNVSILKEDYYMPQLDRYRRISVYLPPGYDSTDKRYPVLYMHDGQNLFDTQNSFSVVWEVDETLNMLERQGYNVPIVIGIDNGRIHRIDELSPWGNPEYGGGQGNAYLDFIVQTLKPNIDAQYRTHPDRLHTGIIGSSLGGNISIYGALLYHDVFGKAGPFSPAYWFVSDSLFAFIGRLEKKDDIRFYQNTGELEGEMHMELLFKMEDSLKMKGYENIISKVIPGGKHDENTWKKDFEEAYLWLFGAWANGIAEDDFEGSIICELSPNEKTLISTNIRIEKGNRIKILNEQGDVVSKYKCKKTTETIDVSNLGAGRFTLIILKSKLLYAGRFVKC